MTPQSKDTQDGPEERRLDSILQTVRSIEQMVEKLLERFDEYFEKDDFEPVWARDYDAYLNSDH